MSRKGQSITLSVSDRDKAQLEAIASELGMMWGDRPNISKLVEAIARRHLQIAPNHNWSPERIKALETARKALVDLGKMPEAEEIARLLSDRSELSIPFRAEIEQFLTNPLPAWRQQVDNLIYRKQPFRLSYRDAADRLWTYTVLHARIAPLEKRQYLVCRTEEFEGNHDVEGLRHNWSLRLDRIQEAAVVSLAKPWEKDLETIPVEFHLSGRLAFAYARKTEDAFVSEIEGDPPVKRVVRNIFSTFWFFREIAPYGEDCTIVSPESVRSRVVDKLKSLCSQYDLEIRD
ncbi:MAG: WYL domain-containing protein [Microcoleus sp. T3-bin5]|nr:WYL domain-containing protein [Microcoleus sp. T3-bin5]